jgi:hypothetical protein
VDHWKVISGLAVLANGRTEMPYTLPETIGFDFSSIRQLVLHRRMELFA